MQELKRKSQPTLADDLREAAPLRDGCRWEVMDNPKRSVLTIELTGAPKTISLTIASPTRLLSVAPLLLRPISPSSSFPSANSRSSNTDYRHLSLHQPYWNSLYNFMTKRTAASIELRNIDFRASRAGQELSGKSISKLRVLQLQRGILSFRRASPPPFLTKPHRERVANHDRAPSPRNTIFFMEVRDEMNLWMNY